MKNTYQAVLAVALGLASAATLKASSGFDLIVGFTGSSTDFLIDIGPVSSSAYPGATGLSNGETWDLGSYLTGVSISPSGATWGVIGDAGYNDGASTPTLWVTTSGYTPASLGSDTAFSVPDGGITAIEQYGFGGEEGPQGYESSSGQMLTIAASNPNSWNEQTASGTLATDFGYSYTDPNVSGETSDVLWQVPQGGTPTEVGTFTLNASGVLTFNFASAGAPAPKITSVTRSGNTTTVYFTTVSSHIYTLYYTNSAGLLAPLSKWPTNTITSTGTGGTNSLTDTTGNANRFYTVGVR